jgi:hypothetical protein
MLIIAKKKDYYDGVAGTTGIDKTIVYDRQIIEVEENDIPILFARKRYHFGKNDQTSFHNISYYDIKKELRVLYHECAYFVIGFCGKLYIGWKLYSIGKEEDGSDALITTITYDFDNMKKIVEPKTWGGRKFVDDVNYIVNHNVIDLFRELNAPVFVYDSDYGKVSIYRHSYGNFHPKFIINPLLKEYQFYKVFNTVQAFQEISMFMGGVLGNKEKEIVEVADKYKIGQHGFDKWSFRKMPEDGKV